MGCEWKENSANLRDSEPGFETRGPEFLQESMAPICHKKEWTYRLGEATTFRHSDRLLEGTINYNSGCLKQNVTDLSLCQTGSITSSECNFGITRTCFDSPLVIEAVENSTSSGTTPPYSLKDLRQLQFAYSSKDACIASPVEESEAMRKWKEMKQNGFLSHPHGGVPMPEPQHGKPSKRKTKGIYQKRKMETSKAEQDNRKTETAKAEQDNWKMETAKGRQDNRKIETAKSGQDNRKMETAKRGQRNRKMETAKRGQGKRKMETVKGEQDNMLKNAPSSGLLSRISTGIIRRVKNYEEVHAILEDLLRLGKPDDQIQNEFIGREESESREITRATNYQKQLFRYLYGASFLPFSDQKGKGILSENCEERSHPEAATITSCLSDYYKKLPLALTSSSVITTRKCDISLTVEQDLSRQLIPPNSEKGDGSHDSDNAEESFSHETVIASQYLLDHYNKGPLDMITSSDISARACDGDSSEEHKSIFSQSVKHHSQ